MEGLSLKVEEDKREKLNFPAILITAGTLPIRPNDLRATFLDLNLALSRTPPHATPRNTHQEAARSHCLHDRRRAMSPAALCLYNIAFFLPVTPYASLLPASTRPPRLPFALSATLGKGDSTIKTLNTFESIVVDPTLVNDVAFWDWALIPTEQNNMKLYACAFDNSDASSSLAASGADMADIDYYDLFHEDSVPPTSEAVSALRRPSALLVSAGTYGAFEAVVREFDKIILVRWGESEGEELPTSDIDVRSLGELRALSICSYALLTKKT